MRATIYDSAAESQAPIPVAPYYVLSNDTFMSGWGPAQGRTNTCVCPCASHQEALRVARYAGNRGDQKYVRIVRHPPRKRPGVLYSLTSGWVATSIDSP